MRHSAPKEGLVVQTRTGVRIRRQVPRPGCVESYSHLLRVAALRLCPCVRPPVYTIASLRHVRCTDKGSHLGRHSLPFGFIQDCASAATTVPFAMAIWSLRRRWSAGQGMPCYHSGGLGDGRWLERGARQGINVRRHLLPASIHLACVVWYGWHDERQMRPSAVVPIPFVLGVVRNIFHVPKA